MNKENTLLLLDDVVSKLNVNISGNETLVLTQNVLVEDLSQVGIDNVYDIISFYTNVSLACHVGSLSLDRSSSNFKFGFYEVADILSALQVSTNAGSDYNSSVKTQLVVEDLRQERLSDLSDSQIMQVLVDDIATVRSSMGIDISDSGASSDVKESVSEDVESTLMKKLKGNSLLRSSVGVSVKNILEVYDEAISLGYVLDPFEAIVLNDKGVGMLEYRGASLAQPVTTASLSLSVDIMSSLSGVKVSRDTRQINLEEIYRSDVPVYFPLKIAEFALGLNVTSRSTSMSYQRASLIWDNKTKGGYSHRGKVERYLTDRLWDYVELVTKAEHLENEEVFHVSGIPMSLDLSARYESFIIKFVHSMSTFAILKSHVGDGEIWASAEWVVSAPSNVMLPSSFGVSSRTYKQVFNSEGEITSPIEREIKGISVLHYIHVANQEIADSEPLFAYKALEALNNKGEKLSVKNLLLGRGLDGRLIMSNPESAVYLGRSLITAINSGSRSGKGVMTATAMATSVVAGRPIFGSDRKPDTMVPFYEAFGGADDKGTPKGYFIQGGAIDKANMMASDSIKDELDWNRNPKILGRKERLVPSWRIGVNGYTSFWGDFAYYRHTLLTMGILALRSKAKGDDPSLYAKLNGDEGIMVIYDEISAWIENFSSKMLTDENFFNVYGNILTVNDMGKIDKALETLSNPLSKDSKKDTARETLSSFRGDSFKLKLYNKDLFEKLDESRSFLFEKAVAGFKGIESIYSDVYIIGQNLKIASNAKLPRTSGGDPGTLNYNKDKKYVKDGWISFLYELDTSFILGFNEPVPQQGWRNVDGSDSKKYLTETARRFAYFGNASFEELRDGEPKDKKRANSVNSYKEDGAVYFKPYLILGGHKDDDPAIEQMEGKLGARTQAIKDRNSRDGGKTWDERVAVIPYLNAMGASDISASFVRAREIADMVVHQMGYDGDYLDFLLDLRPEWNFSVRDVVDAFFVKDANKLRVENLYYTRYLNKVSGVSNTSGSESLSSDDMFAYKADAESIVSDKNSQFEGSYESVTDNVEVGNSHSTELFRDKVKTVASEVPSYSKEDLPEVSVPVRESHGISDDVYDTPERQSIPEQVRIPKVESGTVSKLSSDLGIDEVTIQAVLSALLSGATYNNGLSQYSSPVGSVSGSSERLSRLDRLNTESTHDLSNGSGSSKIDLSEQVSSFLPRLSNALVHSLVLGKPFDEAVRYWFDYGSEDYSLVSTSVREVSVVNGNLVLNGHKLTFDAESYIELPRLSMFELSDLRSNKFADYFSFAPPLLELFRGVTTIEFPSLSYILGNYELVSTWGLNSNNVDKFFSILFDYLPMLQVIVVGSDRITRSDLIEQKIANQSMFSSYKRRQQVIGFVDGRGGNLRRNSWSRAKKNFNEEHTFRAIGNTAVAGVGLGVQGVSKVASGVNTFITGASRLAKAIAKDLADDRSKVKK